MDFGPVGAYCLPAISQEISFHIRQNQIDKLTTNVPIKQRPVS